MAKKNVSTPRLEIHPKRIIHNATRVFELCAENGIEVTPVTKVVAAHQAVVAALRKTAGRFDSTMLADSRLENLREIRKQGFKGKLMLTRIPTLSRARETAEVANVTLVSSLKQLEVLGRAARALRKRHQSILMVDLGDLREGVWLDHAVDLVGAATRIKGVELIGLGTNLACFGGVIPNADNLGKLVELTETCRKLTGLELPLVSGGNSSSLPLLRQGKMPKGINHLRVGETILLGTNVIDRSAFDGTRQDAFVAVGEIIELETKPSKPVGVRGQDAFGKTVDFADRGRRRRAIVNLGRQDAVPEGLRPVASGLEVLGASSDHLIVDVEAFSGELKLGDELQFYPDYGALLALSTSRYVSKITRNSVQ